MPSVPEFPSLYLDVDGRPLREFGVIGTFGVADTDSRVLRVFTPSETPSTIVVLAEIVSLQCLVLEATHPFEVIPLQCRVIPSDARLVARALPFPVQLRCLVIQPQEDPTALVVGAMGGIGGLYTDMHRHRLLEDDRELILMGVL